MGFGTTGKNNKIILHLSCSASCCASYVHAIRAVPMGKSDVGVWVVRAGLLCDAASASTATTDCTSFPRAKEPSGHTGKHTLSIECPADHRYATVCRPGEFFCTESRLLSVPSIEVMVHALLIALQSRSASTEPRRGATYVSAWL